MRTWAIVILSVLILGSLAPGAQAAEHVWVVYNAGELDERIERQLDKLAAQDQALIRIFDTTVVRTRVVPAAGGLTLELRKEEDSAAFLDALEREAGAGAMAPTPELAREGYLIEGNYPRAVVPNRLRITATTWRGVHNALLRVRDLLALSPLIFPATSFPIPRPCASNGAASPPSSRISPPSPSAAWWKASTARPGRTRTVSMFCASRGRTR